jgi:PAS domain S-box-containing protein
MYVWFLLAALGIAVVAIGFFVVTIFSLQDMLDVQRKTEDRLRENEEWLRAVLDNGKTLIAVKRLDGRYVMMNGRFESVFGVSALLAHGRRDDEVFPPAVAAALREQDDRVVATNDSVEFDQTVTVGGSTRQLYCVKTPLHDLIGKPSAICLVATDMTERELARQERDRIFELSLDMMTAGTFDGYMTLVNPQFERFTGYTRHELTSTPGIDIVHPDDRVDAAKAMHALRSGIPVVDYRVRIRCKDGAYRMSQWRAMPAVEEGMIYCVGREVADESRTDEQTTARNEEKSGTVRALRPIRRSS